MPKFSANLTMLFGEVSFEQRFAASKEAGFHYVEYMFPYDYEAQELSAYLKKNDLKQVLFNLPAGNWTEGDRGIAAHPERIDEFRQGVDRALEYAKVLNVDLINCLVGKQIEGVSQSQQWKVLVENLAYAAEKLASDNRLLLIEPINTFDIPGFLLSTTRQGIELIKEVKADNLKIQYDVYHMQKMEGNLVSTIEANLERIGHIQIADNPGRHQPGTGEINYRFVLEAIDKMGYEGYIGLEYIPEPDTKASLSWIESLGFSL
ncbi:MAG: hydroxypyruvate isomerase [Deltaproteobacteria bacterium]|nr:hydroxypyruvate isomerase [Deltaproteobacteria bacterium]MBW2150744.1 hydroxypyruvate isomerase [Deltaproteobacteria bacterium]